MDGLPSRPAGMTRPGAGNNGLVLIRFDDDGDDSRGNRDPLLAPFLSGVALLACWLAFVLAALRFTS